MQARHAICLMVALLILPAVAQAHGPTRQKLTKKIEINAPADKVWAVIQNFHDRAGILPY